MTPGLPCVPAFRMPSRFAFIAAFLIICTTAFCQTPAPAGLKIDTGDTAWMLMSSALVLLMTPALGLFYGGMVRTKNVLNMLMQSFVAMAVITLLWVLVGYSLAFSKGTPYIGKKYKFAVAVPIF